LTELRTSYGVDQENAEKKQDREKERRREGES
jgi:hypothetical protein